MAKLRTAMDAGFWDLNISTAQSLDGVAYSIPGETFPVDISRASRFLRILHLDVLRSGFPLGMVPHWSPTPHKELGDFALQSRFYPFSSTNQWVGFVGQVRPKTLISALKAEVAAVEEWDISVAKDLAMTFLEESVYSVGLLSQMALGRSCSILLNLEKYGEGKGIKKKLMMYRKFPRHIVKYEGAWPGLFIDSKGKYWEVPESVSLDCLSFTKNPGLCYRFGLHYNEGIPRAVDSSTDEAPLSLLPGLCTKAALSYEKHKDIWRVKETEKDRIIDTPVGMFFRPSYDIRLNEPQASVSGIIGAACTSWFHTRKSTAPGANSSETRDHADSRSPFSVNLFGSGCCTFQHGKFRNLFGDLTRLDVRLDVPKASVLLKQLSNVLVKNAANRDSYDVQSSPRLNFIFQQQIAGPYVFRVDSKFLLGSSSGGGPHMEDFVLSLNYHAKILRSGKITAWYSPKRKEAMLEMRMFDF